MASQFTEVDKNGIQDLMVSNEKENTLAKCISEVNNSKGSWTCNDLIGFEESVQRVLPSMS